MPVKNLYFLLLISIYFLIVACNNSSNEKALPTIGFIDYIEDETLAKAKNGFFDALSDNGFKENINFKLVYKNAQGDPAALMQNVDYIVSTSPKFIACNTTLATISTCQRNKKIPIFMMVAPRPDIAKLVDDKGRPPANLFGTYETLDYIDTAIALIPTLIPNAKSVGAIYSQSENQSLDAFHLLEKKCTQLGLTLIASPITNTAETQLITRAILSKHVDCFFALPDNVIFSSFETVVKACDDYKVPIFTSESGLVDRGAMVSFGADLYLWGYQTGIDAAKFLRSNSTDALKPTIVQQRKKVANFKKCSDFKIVLDSSFVIIK